MAASRAHLAAAAAALFVVLLVQLPTATDAQGVPGFPAGYCWIPSLECESVLVHINSVLRLLRGLHPLRTQPPHAHQRQHLMIIKTTGLEPTVTADGKKYGTAYQGCCTRSSGARECNAYHSQYTNQWWVSFFEWVVSLWRRRWCESVRVCVGVVSTRL
jgi:hypothetical protein